MISVQPEFDLPEWDPVERELQERWRRNEAAYREGEGSEVCRCLSWLWKCDGRAWLDWFNSQPSYKREHYLNAYRAERSFADAIGEPMRAYELSIPSREEIEQNEAIINGFVSEIRQAALDRRPMPLAESEDMTGFERMTFRSRLSCAFQRAGVVIIESQPTNEKPSRRK